MRFDVLEVDESFTEPRPLRSLSGMDVEAAMLALSGRSVVDLFGLRFRTLEEVHRFLALWHCDVVAHEWARERVRYLYNQAVEYLEEQVGVHFLKEVRRPADVAMVFLKASQRGRFSRAAIQYCAVLKLMHVINHLEMQELRAQCPIREQDLTEHAYNVVIAQAPRMRADGVALHHFYGNRKTRPSVITKLLAKREATAAQIFDKLRFRIVTETRDDIVPALAWLFRNLIPFPAVVPGESHNNLLGREELAAILRQVPDYDGEPPPDEPTLLNPYSGEVYRVINFIVHLPIRVYDLPGMPAPPRQRALLGEAVMVSVEFQVLDAETDARNETGENRHDRYKERQMQKVYERLGRHAFARH